jgi:DNA (cytosine-5)-methyltransferase 1
MKILNLYSGLGGNRKLWKGVSVTAVRITNSEIAAVYKKHFPNDKLIIGDAHEYLRNHFREYDFIWSSPPCQSHSKMMRATRHTINTYPDLTLYEEIMLLKYSLQRVLGSRKCCPLL